MVLSICFILVTLLSIILFYIGVGNDKKFLTLCVLWLSLISIISICGFLENTISSPPRFIFVMLPSIGLTVYFYKRAIQRKLHRNALLAIHILRIPVEIVLYKLFLESKIPKLMTFEGWNFDILMGISALIIFSFQYFKRKSLKHTLFVTWNIIGLIFLSIIVCLAILSAPLPIQQLAFDQPNIAVLEFPFTFLPTFVVPIVYLSHLLLLRKEN